jgi:hypothetical protein
MRYKEKVSFITAFIDLNIHIAEITTIGVCAIIFDK